MRYEKKESIGCIYEQSDVEECHVESSSCKIRKRFSLSKERETLEFHGTHKNIEKTQESQMLEKYEL